LQARNNPLLRYAYIQYTEQYRINLLILVPKGKVFRLKRHMQKQNVLANQEMSPILQPGMLNDILDGSVGFLSYMALQEMAKLWFVDG